MTKLSHAMRRLAAAAAIATIAALPAAAKDNVLHIYNWADYIGETTVADFEVKAGETTKVDFTIAYKVPKALPKPKIEPQKPIIK